MLVRVALDTCVVRNHLCQESARLDLDAIVANTEQLRFSLAYGTSLELLEQLVKPDGGISWSEWTDGVPEVNRFLDWRWPIMPTGFRLAKLAGTLVGIAADIEDERRRLRAFWRFMSHAKEIEDLEKHTEYEGANGKRFLLPPLYPQRLRRLAIMEREKWQCYICGIQSLLPELGYEHPTPEVILELMRKGQGTGPDDPLDLSERLDVSNQMIAYLVSDALKKKEPYNPRSNRKWGDAFDIPLLFYVPLPCVICTADTEFVRRLNRVEAPRARQVVSVECFNKLVRHNEVYKLVRDFRTPEEQHRQWSEAAYFNWINRGRPSNDDQKDWFDAEPIA